MFAPHVGVDCNGNIGKVHRQGIDGATTACGAAVGAYNAVLADKANGKFQDGFRDHQMDCIKHLLADRVENIKGTENEMSTLAFQMYEIIEDYLENIIDMKWAGKQSKLAIIGGIMINCDEFGSDRFVPLKFELLHKDGARDDLYQKTFGRPRYVSKSVMPTSNTQTA